LKRIIDDQHARLGEAQEKLSKVRKKQSGLEDRMNNAMHQHNLLEQRLHCLKNLPGAHKKPLSKAEREFKSELGNQFYAYTILMKLHKFLRDISYFGPSITVSCAEL
jgi:predicted nuclease with TOPRIM domain